MTKRRRKRTTPIVPDQLSPWHAKIRHTCAVDALIRLREARDSLTAGACHQAAKYVRRAMKSVEGAIRHAEGLKIRADERAAPEIKAREDARRAAARSISRRAREVRDSVTGTGTDFA